MKQLGLRQLWRAGAAFRFLDVPPRVCLRQVDAIMVPDQDAIGGFEAWPDAAPDPIRATGAGPRAGAVEAGEHGHRIARSCTPTGPVPAIPDREDGPG